MGDIFARLKKSLTDISQVVDNCQFSAVNGSGGRQAAVQILLSAHDDPDLIFTERSHKLNNHAGQISFPGGIRDDTDISIVETAQRETFEEIGLPPQQVHPLGVLSGVTVIPASGFEVITVVSKWSGDFPLQIVDSNEVSAIHRFRISQLADPDCRVTAKFGDYLGPAFVFQEVFIWGFTANLTATLLDLGGWARPWHANRVAEVPKKFSTGKNGT